MGRYEQARSCDNGAPMAVVEGSHRTCWSRLLRAASSRRIRFLWVCRREPFRKSASEVLRWDTLQL